MNQQAFKPLDQEEKELMEAEERGEFRSVSPKEFIRLKKELVSAVKSLFKDLK